MIVTVTRADLDTVSHEGSVIAVTGTDEDGRRVRFASDAQAMVPALAGIRTDGQAVCQVEPWMVLGVDQ